MAKAVSTLHSELQKWRIVQANPSVTSVWRGNPYKLRGNVGKGQACGGEPELTKFSSKEKMTRDALKTAAREA